ncbi:MAG: OmpA family protein [Bacteroidales bacterium]|nr:OmpA family protein [Bacteroidales bacterium]
MKDIRRYIITALILLLILPATQAQVKKAENFSASKLKRLGKRAAEAKDYYTAIYYFENYRDKKSDDSKINYELAELHRTVRNYLQARELYKEVYLIDEMRYPLARFYYAQMLKATGEYEEAVEEFSEFRKEYKGEKDSRDMRKLARNEIAGCDSAIIMLENQLDITIEKMNSTINGPHIELSPLLIDDNNFIYGSLKVDTLIFFTQQNVDTAMPVRQFYLAHKEGMDWIGGERVNAAFNAPGIETGNGILSRDGKRFYFTQCQKNWQGKVICSIYRTEKKEGKWTDPIKLPTIINDPNYTATQPALGRTANSDREIIFFVSDRPEGKGGLDLWYTVWNEEKNLFSEPRNLGSRINTPGDEMTPFYNLSTRTLYFSSDGLPGMGGLDIFSAFGERRKWEYIKNIGYPLNSSYDDLYFTVSRKEEDGLFVSNRPDSLVDEACCDDIFFYRWNDFIRITVTGVIYPFEQDRFGRTQDLSDFDFMNPDENIQPLDSAKIALYMEDKSTREYVFIDRYTTADDGRFYFTLMPDQDYEFRMEGFQYFQSKNYLSTQFFTSSDTIEMPPTWVNVLSGKPIVLKNIYYDIDEAELTRESKNVIDTTLLILLTEAPEFIVEIGAHTDSIGETQYNLELSQLRSDNVVKYLVSKGIPENRLVAKGYGAMKPVAPNYKPDGTDNPEGREQNRRTEFRVVGTIGVEEEDEVYVE